MDARGSKCPLRETVSVRRQDELHPFIRRADARFGWFMNFKYLVAMSLVINLCLCFKTHIRGAMDIHLDFNSKVSCLYH